MTDEPNIDRRAQQMGRITFGPPLSDSERQELLRQARETWGRSVHAAQTLDTEVGRLRVEVAKGDAEIIRLRGVIAQLREDWRPKAQQEVAAMTAAREVARCRLLYTTLPALDTCQAAMATSALDRLIEALRDG